MRPIRRFSSILAIIMIQTALVVHSNSATTPYSRSSSYSCSTGTGSSPSLVRHTGMVAPEQASEATSSSAIVPIDEQLPDSESKQNSNSRQSSSTQNHDNSRELSTTSESKDNNNPTTTTTTTTTTNTIPSQTIFHQLYLTITRFHPTLRLVLQNKASVARDHLASERTFLAYVRTSLGLASAGVALVQLFTMADLISRSTGVPLPAVNQKLQKFVIPLGLTALAMALIVLIIGEILFFLFFLFLFLPDSLFFLFFLKKF